MFPDVCKSDGFEQQRVICRERIFLHFFSIPTADRFVIAGQSNAIPLIFQHTVYLGEHLIHVVDIVIERIP